MKYISHIKELVSGIIDNNLVTRDTEAYNALTALKNHLDTLEEVQKYMPYKDPGPVIEKLEQSLAQANTKNQELRKQALYLNEEIEQKTKSRDQCYKYWQEYKSKYETLEQKYQEQKKKFQDLNDENSHNIAIIDQNHQAIENYQNLKEELKKLKSDKEDLIKEAESLDNLIRSQDTQIQDLKDQLQQKNLYIEDLTTQLPDDQPQYSNTQQHYRSKKQGR